MNIILILTFLIFLVLCILKYNPRKNNIIDKIVDVIPVIKLSNTHHESDDNNSNCEILMINPNRKILNNHVHNLIDNKVDNIKENKILNKKIPSPIIDYDLTKIMKNYVPVNDLIDGTVIIEKNNSEVDNIFKIKNANKYTHIKNQTHPWYYNTSSKYANIDQIEKLPNLNIKPTINKEYINESPIFSGYHYINDGQYDNLYTNKLYLNDINNGILEYNNIQNSLSGEYIPNKTSTSNFTQIENCFK